MASVQLSDVIIPQVYLSYDTVDSPELLALNTSGVLYNNPVLTESLANGGTVFTVPFWNDVNVATEPNYTTDNVGDVATPDKITAGDWLARKAELNYGWSAADLIAELAGSDPMQRIRSRTDFFWSIQKKKRLLATMNGIRLGNIANNNSDMIVDVSTQNGAAATASNLFSRQSFVNAIFTLGDHYNDIIAIAVHSTVLANMIAQQLINYVQPANVPIKLPYYDDKLVIVDDDMPVIAGTTSGYRYISYLFGSRAVGIAESLPKIPVEIYRRPDQGMGGGVDQLWERKNWLIHPRGFSFLSSTISGGQSATLADLQLAANWSRVVPRKLVPFAFLITNG
ncbi:MAG: hypothetical protein WAN50_00325 [Minisyncoccia bacterium]